jgi:ABC-type multidrug transport system ATPase subunit
MELIIQNVCKSYKEVKALNDFSITMTDGIYGLLGPNGAGKTTLMRIITDNMDADSGHIFFNGKDIKQMGKNYRSILGYMPQHNAAYSSFTSKQFLSYIGSLKGMQKEDIQSQVPMLLKRVNLYENMNSRIGSFSGGMKQRIMLAQALLGDPKVIILDEPTAGLDPKERIRIRNLISGFALNRIVIIATHVVSDIEFIAKEIILLKKGSIVLHDAPDVLCRMIENKVYEIYSDISAIDEISEKFEVCNIQKGIDRLAIRVLLKDNQNKENLKDYENVALRASVEDVYLFVFDEEREKKVV